MLCAFNGKLIICECALYGDLDAFPVINVFAWSHLCHMIFIDGLIAYIAIYLLLWLFWSRMNLTAAN
jgi:hypothetical protein